MTVDLRNPNNL